jgi:hypothetical protein
MAARPSLEAMVAETGAQIRALKLLVAAKQKLLADTRAQEAAEIVRLRENVISLRLELKEKKAYLSRNTQKYSQDKENGVSSPPGLPPRQLTTAICSFPNSTTVAVEYGNTPQHCFSEIADARQNWLPT